MTSQHVRLCGVKSICICQAEQSVCMKVTKSELGSTLLYIVNQANSKNLISLFVNVYNLSTEEVFSGNKHNVLDEAHGR